MSCKMASFNVEQNKGGVYYNKLERCWKPYQHIDGKRVWIGRFETKEAATIEFNKAQVRQFGKDARLKHIEG